MTDRNAIVRELFHQVFTYTGHVHEKSFHNNRKWDTSLISALAVPVAGFFLWGLPVCLFGRGCRQEEYEKCEVILTNKAVVLKFHLYGCGVCCLRQVSFERVLHKQLTLFRPLGILPLPFRASMFVFACQHYSSPGRAVRTTTSSSLTQQVLTIPLENIKRVRLAMNTCKHNCGPLPPCLAGCQGRERNTSADCLTP